MRRLSPGRHHPSTLEAVRTPLFTTCAPFQPPTTTRSSLCQHTADSHLIFRGIKATLERRTLEDSGKGRRKLFVHHQAATRFLWLQVTFSTQLLVEEDDRAVSACGWGCRDAVSPQLTHVARAPANACTVQCSQQV
jgi:hypothetical protein